MSRILRVYISNLNNTRYVPNASRITVDSNEKSYAYGIFALVEVSNFKNTVKLTGGKDTLYNGILEIGTYNSIK